MRTIPYLYKRLIDYIGLPALQRPKSFRFNEKYYRYHINKKNMTWSTERCVEISLALNFAMGGIRILEVGNVLNQYHKFNHDVVDLYEKERGVINEDILLYKPISPYDTIISVSTIEHIPKYRDALDRMFSMLTPKGRMLVTFGMGFNKELDEDCLDCYFSDIRYMKRIRYTGWCEVSRNYVVNPTWSKQYPASDYLCICQYGK